MRISKWTYVAAFAALALSIRGYGQENPPHHVYKLTPVGTFGGPDSFGDGTGPANFNLNYLNNLGGTVGTASTSTADPFAPDCLFDCNVDDAFVFQNGKLTSLGALTATDSSWAFGLNDFGLVIGVSENGLADPATGYPEYHAVVWNDGKIKDLGTLGGSVSLAQAVNDLGMVVGAAANDIPDDYANSLGPCTTLQCWPVTTQLRAFLWQGGKMKDLGTLGGNDAVAVLVNQLGQVVGESYTNATPNATTGVPTQDPFLWQFGKMIDLGTLGGTFGEVSSINNRGQIVGQSNVTGDYGPHPFLWQKGVMTDLGDLVTIPGEAGPAGADWVNDFGEVVGVSINNDYAFHAFLWRQGTMTDLGTLGGTSVAYGINAGGQVVGFSYAGTCPPCTPVNDAFLWEVGGPMVDLNTLVENPSNLRLTGAYAISDSGEILAQGILPNGDTRVAVLTPDGICNAACEARIAASQTAQTAAVQTDPVALATRNTSSLLGKGSSIVQTPLGMRNFWPKTAPAPAN